QERLHRAVRLEEGLHVYDEILFKGQALDRLNVDRLCDVEILDEGLARETVATVDAHRVRSTNAVSAGAAERERAVDIPLDLVQRVENTVGRVQVDVEVFPVRVAARFGVEAANEKGDGKRLRRLGRLDLGSLSSSG